MLWVLLLFSCATPVGGERLCPWLADEAGACQENSAGAGCIAVSCSLDPIFDACSTGTYMEVVTSEFALADAEEACTGAYDWFNEPTVECEGPTTQRIVACAEQKRK